MNTEQEQLVEQIRLRADHLKVGREPSAEGDVDRVYENTISALLTDIDYLLSLVKSQETLSGKDDDLARFVLRCIRGCATGDQYIETLERVKTAFVSVREDATTYAQCLCRKGEGNGRTVATGSIEGGPHVQRQN